MSREPFAREVNAHFKRYVIDCRHGVRPDAVSPIYIQSKRQMVLLAHRRWLAESSLTKYFVFAHSGPDIQYADRNDIQRIFSGLGKNNLFQWGKYEGGGPYAVPTCRDVRRLEQMSGIMTCKSLRSSCSWVLRKCWKRGHFTSTTYSTFNSEKSSLPIKHRGVVTLHVIMLMSEQRAGCVLLVV